MLKFTDFKPSQLSLVAIAAFGLVHTARADSSGCIQSTLLGTFSPTGALKNDVAVSGTTAFVTAGSAGVFALDVSDPDSISLVGSYDTPSQADGIFVENGTAYVADRAGGLLILDVSDPTSMMLLGSYDTPGVATNVFVSGGVAYLADQFSVQIIDVSQPSNPVFLSEFGPTQNGYRDISAVGSTVYAANRFSGFEIIDVSDPINPTLISQSSTPYMGLGIAVSGVYLYLAAGELRIVDISDLSNPTEIGPANFPSGAQDVVVNGCTLFLANNSLPPFDGVQIVDVTDPTEPTLLSNLRPFGSIAVVQEGDRLYAISESAGLGVIGIQECRADLNCDGTIDFFDVSQFLTWYNTQDARADFSSDGIFNFFDVSAFLSLYNQGCPE